MPSRMLLCLDCGTKPVIPESRGTHTLYVWGKSKLTRPPIGIEVLNGRGKVIKKIEVPTMVCDACERPIAQGDIACAWTFWMNPQTAPAWESEYLDPIVGRSQHDW